MRKLVLIVLALLVIGHGFDPDAACTLKCEVTEGGGCCSGPAPHDPRSDCCKSISHVPTDLLAPSAALPPSVQDVGAVVCVAPAASLLAHAPANRADALVLPATAPPRRSLVLRI